MTDAANAKSVLIVTGMSGAGKSTVLNTLEDMGWEVIDNFPLRLIDRLLANGPGGDEGDRPLAIGIGVQTRDFDPERLINRIDALRAPEIRPIGTLFLDCANGELERRYSQTRRRHPLALDRPAADGIIQERTLLAPLRSWSNRLIDTTSLTANELAAQIRETFGALGTTEPTLSVMSFGFARGIPRGADLVLDMRFLRNPHWVPDLRPGTGLDPPVADYVKGDPAYGEAMAAIDTLLLTLLPRYRAEGKSYVTIAFGCTGGRHRSVHVAERTASLLRARGFSPTVNHRDLGAAPQDALEGAPSDAQARSRHGD
ncbi:MAG: RNase adaptor protein RapZ [Proteobacteria bacterium SG_bin5]|nr:RNase adapter RapZ [Sphingomonas sp.]OQW39010.1 MAG: RNase adaptor protein RapZ [Proteobacteria bacterium SG_bin5]